MGNRRLKQAAQREVAVFFPGYIQSPSGHDPRQPAPDEPALAGTVGLGDLQRSPPTPTIL